MLRCWTRSQVFTSGNVNPLESVVRKEARVYSFAENSSVFFLSKYIASATPVRLKTMSPQQTNVSIRVSRFM